MQICVNAKVMQLPVCGYAPIHPQVIPALWNNYPQLKPFGIVHDNLFYWCETRKYFFQGLYFKIKIRYYVPELVCSLLHEATCLKTIGITLMRSC